MVASQIVKIVAAPEEGDAAATDVANDDTEFVWMMVKWMTAVFMTGMMCGMAMMRTIMIMVMTSTGAAPSGSVTTCLDAGLEAGTQTGGIRSERPSRIWCAPKTGTKYHVNRHCTGLNRAIESRGLEPCDTCCCG